jgi:hypothetical protein
METTMQQQRRRKVLLVMPLLVLPFLTFLFWTLGGGQANAGKQLVDDHNGFNTHLPDAKLKDDHNLGKLGYYDRASADSAKLKQASQTDPYAKKQTDSLQGHSLLTDNAYAPHQPGYVEQGGGGLPNSPSAKAALINKRIADLQTEISKPAPVATSYPPPNAPSNTTPAGTADLNKNSIPGQPIVASAEDPELKQMNGLLEKILDIQHPDRLREKLAGGTVTDEKRFQAIPAIIDGNQKIVQGTVIRMKLLDSVRLNGQLFPKGQLIYGSGDLYNQRVKVNIKLIHIGLNIIPVDLSVYDMTDGMEGINVPEAVTGDAVRDGAVSGVQDMNLMSFDPSMGAQLTTAGINTAKGLFSKKVKRVKGKLKGGHELLLRDNKSLQAVNH